jgi:hypothetical protein
VKSIDNYFHDFRWPVECVTIKIAIVIENGRSLKLRQMRQVNASLPLILPPPIAHVHGQYPAQSRVLGSGFEVVGTVGR